MSVTFFLLILALVLTIVSMLKPNWPLLSVAVLLTIIAILIGTNDFGR
jgi:hypothetical protein